jgi:hypothetical protein
LEARRGWTDDEDEDEDEDRDPGARGMSSDGARRDSKLRGRSTGLVGLAVDIGINGGAESDTTGDGTTVISSLLCATEPSRETGRGMG